MGRRRPKARKLAAYLAAVLIGLPAALIAIYRFVPPPVTPLMLIRAAQGYGIDKRWTPLSKISPHLADSVIASEDNLFCEHHGFDVGALSEAIEDMAAGERTRGASTISMQTAKNLFLWPGRTWLRKALEAYLTVMIETLWSKRRILEVYLNVAEWGPGIYGAEAAARAHFGKHARDLTKREAALMAVVLPDPLELSPGRPTDYVADRAQVIETRIAQLGPLLDCARAAP
ncbi:MAG: monofunctional biosynthetic peptidoglycan transglycosylase [Alphaproteobacteria bacterium]